MQPAILYVRGSTLHYGQTIVRLLCSVRRLSPVFGFFCPQTVTPILIALAVGEGGTPGLTRWATIFEHPKVSAPRGSKKGGGARGLSARRQGGASASLSIGASCDVQKANKEKGGRRDKRKQRALRLSCSEAGGTGSLASVVTTAPQIARASHSGRYYIGSVSSHDVNKPSLSVVTILVSQSDQSLNMYTPVWLLLDCILS